MESLEGRLDRLSPEQRKEVEDFVDFLLQRSPPQPAPAPPPQPTPSPLAAAPPVLSVQEPAHDQQLARVTSLIQKPELPRPLHDVDPATLLIQEIASEPQDLLTADYMDYGRFEAAAPRPPSPATEAVQRVKIRLGAKKTQDPSKNLLDWID